MENFPIYENYSFNKSKIEDFKDKLSQYVKEIVNKDIFNLICNDFKILKKLLKKGNEKKVFKNSSIELYYALFKRNGICIEDRLIDIKRLTLNEHAVLPTIENAILSMSEHEESLFIFETSFIKNISLNDNIISSMSGEDIVCYIYVTKIEDAEDLSENKNKSILKYKIIDGIGKDLSLESLDTHVTVDILGAIISTGRIFDKRIEGLILGEWQQHNIPKGALIGIRNLCLGEKAKFVIKSNQAFGKLGNSSLNVEANQNVCYEITLLNYVNALRTSEMNQDELITFCNVKKNNANQLFKNNRFDVAREIYNEIYELCINATFLHDLSEKEEINKMIILSKSNSAQCSLNLNEEHTAINDCITVLEKTSTDSKTYYRLGMGYYLVKDYNNAIDAFTKLLMLKPSLKIAKQYIEKCRNLQKQLTQKEKETCKKMFDKLTNKSLFNERDKNFPEIDEFNPDSAKGMIPLEEEQKMYDDSK